MPIFLFISSTAVAFVMHRKVMQNIRILLWNAYQDIIEIAYMFLQYVDIPLGHF